MLQLYAANGNLDQCSRDLFKKNKNTVIGMILIASYVYYHIPAAECNILSDEVYDKMCKWCLDNWSKVCHPHKYLISEDDLRAGSLYALKEIDYPTIIKVSADIAIRLCKQSENQDGKTISYWDF